MLHPTFDGIMQDILATSKPYRQTYHMAVVCCDCKRLLGSKPGGNKPGLISHGICPECAEKAKQQTREYKP